MRRAWRCAVLGAAGVAVLPSAAAAQQVSGTVVRADSTTPAAQLLVEWRAGAGPLQRVLTDERGRFVLRLRGADSVRIRLLRPGYRPQVVPAFFVDAATVVSPRVVLENRPIVLATVRVQEHQVCAGRGETAAWTLWEQARVAMQAVTLAERDPTLVVEAVEWAGTGPAGETPAIEPSSITRTATTALRSGAQRDSIFRFGYVRRTSDTSYYEAPVPEVLTDDRFAERYCFTVVDADSTPDGLTGVRFEPRARPGPGIAEVTGVFWLDRERYLLRAVEFSYINVPPHHRVAGLGGHLRFVELPSGHWLMHDWLFRMPDLFVTRQSRGNRGLRAEGRTVYTVRRAGETLYADSAAAALARQDPRLRR